MTKIIKILDHLVLFEKDKLSPKYENTLMYFTIGKTFCITREIKTIYNLLHKKILSTYQRNPENTNRISL